MLLFSMLFFLFGYLFIHYIHWNVFFFITDGIKYCVTMTCQLWRFIIPYFLHFHLSMAYTYRSISTGILMSDIRKRALQSLRKFKIHDNYGKVQHKIFFNSERQKKKEMNKMFGFSDVKWLKQFLFKCKFDFLKDGTTSNCTLNGKMKINLKYGMNKVYVDFLGIIFYYENPDVFSFAQSISDFGQLCLGWNANIF